MTYTSSFSSTSYGRRVLRADELGRNNQHFMSIHLLYKPKFGTYEGAARFFTESLQTPVCIITDHLQIRVGFI